MSLMTNLRKMIGSDNPTVINYEAYQNATGTEGTNPDVIQRVGPGGIIPEPNSYKLQHSYDSLLQTVQELRSALDGQLQRQEELLTRLGTLPHAVEALPQTSRLQADTLQVINDRMSMHAQRQRKLNDSLNALAGNSKDAVAAITAIREQLEMGNELDRQLVESFNRFSMMVDRLQAANNHAVDCLQQVRDTCAFALLQVQEWNQKSRSRHTWMINSAFIMSLISLIILLLMLVYRK